MDSGNLFSALPCSLPEEAIDVLLEQGKVRIERIVSTGHATPSGEWYDQQREEWVVLLRGAARLRFEAESEERNLAPGDWLHIPARARHRVTWTRPGEPTVWLAVHLGESCAREAGRADPPGLPGG